MRNNKPDSFERQARRALSGPREASLYEMPLGPAGARAKVKNLFGFGKPKNKWVKLDSRDDWDASEEIPSGHGQARELTDHDVRMVTQTAERHPQVVFPPIHRASTSDSIELSAPDYPNLGIHTTIHNPQYSDPFSTSPITMGSTEEIQEPTPYNASGNGRYAAQGFRTDGDDAGPSPMRKFEGGTRFREEIS